MTSPTVTELPRRLEPVTHDPFIDGLETDRASAEPRHHTTNPPERQ